jgi:hypothetical protein
MGLSTGTADDLHGGLIGDKLKNRAWNFARHAIQKIQREPNAFLGMVRHEAARKKLGCCASRRQGNSLVSRSMR